MNAAYLLIPFILIRFVLLNLLSKSGIRRAAHVPQLAGQLEAFAIFMYQITNVSILIYMFFLQVNINGGAIFQAGACLYGMGLVLLFLAVVNFATPASSGINTNGLYRFSRNPMYVAYFFFFAGCALLTRSHILFILTVVFQATAHVLILAEERWCIETFGEEYLNYKKQVRRYF